VAAVPTVTTNIPTAPILPPAVPVCQICNQVIQNKMSNVSIVVRGGP
jgi:hypothetical protein